MPEDFEAGQDPFVGVTSEPLDLDAEVQRHREGLDKHRLERRLEKLQRQLETRRARWREREQQRNRVYYRWPRYLIEAIKQIADSELISHSQASAFLMVLC